ncbi:MAG: hypothetical protein J2O48_12110 [Solirubrobacterales bacterium]|nr:hypothetical protein [Solirubrobacterales bacterium]
MSAPGDPSFEQLLTLWEQDARNLASFSRPQQRLMERIVDALVAELTRRVGSKFTADELAGFYMQGTEWCFDIAAATAPANPECWDMPTLVGAAFRRFLQRAMDFGGGRRRLEESESDGSQP